MVCVCKGICDLMVRIPMVGRTASLNVVMATAVMLYELFNQKRCKPRTHCKITRE